MGSKRPDRERINVTFDIDTYNQIKLIADKNNNSMSEIVRDWAIQGLNGTLTQQNLDILIPIIREQLNSLLKPAVDRLSKLSAKACVQAGTAAYLSAEALSKFVPDEFIEDFNLAYESARKKSVMYMKNNSDLD